MVVIMPYQCLGVASNLLLAARGPCIDLININDSSVISTWECPRVDALEGKRNSKNQTLNKGSKDVLPESKSPSSPLAKKRKLLTPENSKIDITSIKSKNSGSVRNIASSTINGTSLVTIISASKSGKYVVAVTGEDKSLRVLEVVHTEQVCHLIQLSHRPLPKRPCALVITDDDTTIVSADKFGDVYSLPLLYSVSNSDDISQAPEEKSFKPFLPAANEFTIHSQRNRKALKNQKRQTNQLSHKSGLNFEHKLLLGHVSMLTDIKLATLSGRNYIITSDRDEHIRVSRGIPQAHIIENFCLGHSDFVSRMCIPETRPMILISGGGEDDLFVWDWSSGTLLSKTNLVEHVSIIKKKLGLVTEDCTPNLSRIRLAISGIYHIPAVADHNPVDLIVVSCESLPAFFTFTLSPENTLQYVETTWTVGNVLAICVISSREAIPKGLVVSVDKYHKPGSISEIRSPDSISSAVLNRFELRGNRFLSQPMTVEVPVDMSSEESMCMPSSIVNLLYGVENLRKRGDESLE